MRKKDVKFRTQKQNWRTNQELRQRPMRSRKLSMKHEKKQAEANAKFLAEQEAKRKAEAEAKAKIEAESKAKTEQLEKEYLKFVADGDNSLGSKKYIEAKESYQNALKLKPYENYPKNKINEIDKILLADADAKKKFENYSNFIAKGDAALSDKKYSDAKTNFQMATNILPDEKYPKEKLKEIENLLAADKKAKDETEAMESQYRQFIIQGDNSFRNAQWDQAKSFYNKAIALKNETYPKDQIAKIEAAL